MLNQCTRLQLHFKLLQPKWQAQPWRGNEFHNFNLCRSKHTEIKALRKWRHKRGGFLLMWYDITLSISCSVPRLDNTIPTFTRMCNQIITLFFILCSFYLYIFNEYRLKLNATYHKSTKQFLEKKFLDVVHVSPSEYACEQLKSTRLFTPFLYSFHLRRLNSIIKFKKS